jgi:hypothetical protein
MESNIHSYSEYTADLLRGVPPLFDWFTIEIRCLLFLFSYHIRPARIKLITPVDKPDNTDTNCVQLNVTKILGETFDED